jgi:hypothetical protein
MTQSRANATPSLADLRARRADLNARLAKGLDALRAKEDAGDTGPQYRGWFAFWERLLAQYEAACDQITAQGGPACDHAPCRAETCAECKTLPAAPPPPPAALGVAMRVAGRAPGIFTSEAQVVGLARQLQAFAAGAPILALPTYTGSEDDNGQSTYTI